MIISTKNAPVQKAFPALLFWGAVWGICEATIGYALHLAAVLLPGLPGALMFPIGFLCMFQARKATGMAAAPFWIAIVAAAVKLVDFLIPNFDAIRIVNPALSILLEGLAVAAVFALIPASGLITDSAKALGAGILWRAMFAAHLFVISLFGLPAGLVTSGMGTLLRFVLLESFLNGLVILAGFWLASRLKARKSFVVQPALALAACLCALGLQALL